MPNNRQKLIQQLYEKITGIVRGLRKGQGELFKKYGLSRSHALLLFTISRYKQGVSVKELADTCNITSGAVTQQIDVLVEKDLLQRIESKADRRIVLVKLTEKALNELQMYEESQFNEISDAFNELSNDEVTSLVNLLSKVKVKEAKCNCESVNYKDNKGQ